MQWFVRCLRLASTSSSNATLKTLKQLEESLFATHVKVCEDALPLATAQRRPTGSGEAGEQSASSSTLAASKYKPRQFLHSYTIAPYVNDSKTLRYLVDIGVDLSSLELKPSIGDLLLKLDWKRHVSPLLQFLLRLGLALPDLGPYITKNPWILQQSADQLQQRIDYLKSKRFSDDQIAHIVTKARYWLNFDVQLVDARLGWYQRHFQLTGDQVRSVVVGHPKLITFGTGYTQVLMLTFKNFGFDQDETRQLLLGDPKLFTCYKSVLEKSFDYLHSHVGFSHQTLLGWPRCLREPKHKIKARHEFLAELNRAQYDKCKPNYVPLQALLTGSDEQFCQRVAKVPVRVYDEFLKVQ